MSVRILHLGVLPTVSAKVSTTANSKFKFLSLFTLSHACERCSTPTKETYDSRALCDKCSEEIGADSTTVEHQVLYCPTDGAQMEKAVEHRIVVDRCPACGGVWLGGEARFETSKKKQLI
jgi:hypothetical protein